MEKHEALVKIHDLFCEGINRKGIANTLYKEHGIPLSSGYRYLRHYFESDKYTSHMKALRTDLGNKLLVIFNRNFEEGNRAHDRVAMEAFDRLLNLFPSMKLEEEIKVEPITVQLVGYQKSEAAIAALDTELVEPKGPASDTSNQDR